MRSRSWKDRPYSSRSPIPGASSLDCEAMESRGLIRMPPMEPLVAAHPHPRLSMMSSRSPALPSKSDRFQSALTEKAYKAAALSARALNVRKPGRTLVLSYDTRNAEKSMLSPAQSVIFLGLSLDSVSFTARLSAERIKTFRACLTLFHLRRSVQFSLCLRLLGLMASAILVVRLGRLHMREFQYWVASL